MIGNSASTVVYVVNCHGHHSLVTPIDWKHGCVFSVETVVVVCHHSLVTPIDWKPDDHFSRKVNPSASPLAGDTY